MEGACWRARRGGMHAHRSQPLPGLERRWSKAFRIDACEISCRGRPAGALPSQSAQRRAAPAAPPPLASVPGERASLAWQGGAAATAPQPSSGSEMLSEEISNVARPRKGQPQQRKGRKAPAGGGGKTNRLALRRRGLPSPANRPPLRPTSMPTNNACARANAPPTTAACPPRPTPHLPCARSAGLASVPSMRRASARPAGSGLARGISGMQRSRSARPRWTAGVQLSDPHGHVGRRIWRYWVTEDPPWVEGYVISYDTGAQWVGNDAPRASPRRARGHPPLTLGAVRAYRVGHVLCRVRPQHPRGDDGGRVQLPRSRGCEWRHERGQCVNWREQPARPPPHACPALGSRAASGLRAGRVREPGHPAEQPRRRSLSPAVRPPCAAAGRRDAAANVLGGPAGAPGNEPRTLAGVSSARCCSGSLCAARVLQPALTQVPSKKRKNSLTAPVPETAPFEQGYFLSRLSAAGEDELSQVGGWGRTRHRGGRCALAAGARAGVCGGADSPPSRAVRTQMLMVLERKEKQVEAELQLLDDQAANSERGGRGVGSGRVGGVLRLLGWCARRRGRHRRCPRVAHAHTRTCAAPQAPTWSGAPTWSASSATCATRRRDSWRSCGTRARRNGRGCVPRAPHPTPPP